MLFGAGLPIFFLEMALGQYAGVGPIKIFGRIAPILQGLGYVSLFLSLKIRSNNSLLRFFFPGETRTKLFGRGSRADGLSR